MRKSIQLAYSIFLIGVIGGIHLATQISPQVAIQADDMRCCLEVVNPFIDAEFTPDEVCGFASSCQLSIDCSDLTPGLTAQCSDALPPDEIDLR